MKLEMHFPDDAAVFPRPQGHIVPLFMAMGVVLLATIGATYAVWRMGVMNGAKLREAQITASSLHSILDTMRDAETGQRGFLLTNDPAYLKPYNDVLGRLPGQLADLDAETIDGQLQKSDVEFIHTMVNEKMSELGKTIDLRRSQGFDAALAIVKNDSGRQSMEAIGNRIAVLLSGQEAVIATRDSWRQTLRDAHSVAVAFTLVLNLAFLGWALRRVRAEIRDRESIFTDLLRQKMLLAVTLGSIADAVIVADNSARLTYMNEKAEELTGWRREQAVGQPCAAVFNIINEGTRQPAQSPIERVLQTGLVVGLANHTLLIRKDGSEIPIDDSGAPIRGDDGKVRGVVLVFRDFSHRRETERTLKKAKEEAEAANTAKDNFLATLSHELRTPLTPVLATLTAWEDDRALNAEMLSSVQTLRRNVELEARLIDDLLDLTRIVRGKLPLNLEVADVHQLIEQVAKIYQSDILAKRLAMTMECRAGEHFVNADSARLQQVFWNIIKNAIKFTPAGGRITVRTGNDGPGRVRIAIDDTGVGMSPETLGRVFRPFDQGDREAVKRSGSLGLGLGLAISKALVEAQSGRITASSDGVGKGSSFVVTLPAVASPARRTEVPQLTAATDSDRRRRLNILLVEDHADTARVMSRLLQNRGHQVAVAESVAAALETALAENFDVLLSDIGLSDGTGIDLMNQLRQKRGTTMPAIALTGFGMEEDIARCHEAGFTEHLTKPINFQKLEAAINRVAGSG